MLISDASPVRRGLRDRWPPFRVLSSTGCSSALPASRCWPALWEFALLSGGNAATEEKSSMKCPSGILLAAGIALGLALAAIPAGAQQPAAQAPAPLKPASPGAIAAAKELLTLKNVSAVYSGAVPNIVQRAKDGFLASNLNYQKDL